jgi:hypothetical protein
MISGTALDRPGGFSGLPTDARIIEIRTIPRAVHSNRALVLWMVSPQTFPRSEDEPDAYTCPDETRGWFYRGPTRVSLIDTSLKKIVNTVEIKIPLVSGWEDQFDIPYRIHPKYYRVDPPLRAGEGKPVIIDLKDYNGDGEALEFALYDAEGCSVVTTQLIGYSRRQDRVIQYPIDLKGEGYEGRDPTLLWLDSFLLEKPTREGVWKYSRHYSSGTTATFEIRYDAASERFRGTVQWEDDH